MASDLFENAHLCEEVNFNKMCSRIFELVLSRIFKQSPVLRTELAYKCNHVAHVCYVEARCSCKVVLVDSNPIPRTEPAYVIAQHRSAVWKRRTQLRPIRCLRSSSQSQRSLLHLCSPLLSPPDINAFKISVKRLLAIFLPPPLLATHVQLHPDVDLLVLQLQQDARHSPASRS